MRAIEVYGRRLVVNGGPLAVWIYWKEFGTDIWADLRASSEEDVPNIAVWLQVLWAMNRCAEPHAPGFGEWLGMFPDFNLASPDALGVMDAAISAGFFRVEPPSRWQRLRRWLARRVGRIAQRIGGGEAGI